MGGKNHVKKLVGVPIVTDRTERSISKLAVDHQRKPSRHCLIRKNRSRVIHRVRRRPNEVRHLFFRWRLLLQ